MAISRHYQSIHLEWLTTATTTFICMKNYGEYRNKPTGSINREFHGQLSNYQLLKKSPMPWSEKLSPV
jgi:hypothetical protein